MLKSPLADTEVMRKVYEPISLNRLSGLGHFGVPYTPYLVSPSIGQALIFQSARVLPRAVPPTSGIRKVFQIGLIPWSAPWREFQEEQGEALKSNTNGFPDYQIG